MEKKYRKKANYGEKWLKNSIICDKIAQEIDKSLKTACSNNKNLKWNYSDVVTFYHCLKIWHLHFITSFVVLYDSRKREMHMVQANKTFNFDRISPTRKSEISNYANKIRRDNQIETANFDVLKFLTENIGFRIELRKFTDRNITGMLLVDEENNILPNFNKIIAINDIVVSDTTNGYQRTRFIATHELGHYKLHKKDKKQYAMRDTGHFDTDEEFEAEYFTYCMLMPEKLVETYLSGLESDTENNKVKYIADKFGVTENKSRNWLKELNIIE